jgi:hypothetical protein
MLHDAFSDENRVVNRADIIGDRNAALRAAHRASCEINPHFSTTLAGHHSGSSREKRIDCARESHAPHASQHPPMARIVGARTIDQPSLSVAFSPPLVQTTQRPCSRDERTR